MFCSRVVTHDTILSLRAIRAIPFGPQVTSWIGRKKVPGLSNLLDLLSLASNAFTIFATVSFAASAAAEFVSSALRWRAKSLLDGMKRLLDDRQLQGLALQVYNNLIVNPLGSGGAQSEAQLENIATQVKPEAFGVAILQILHIVPSAIGSNDQPVDPALPLDVRIANARANARRVITLYVSSEANQAALIRFAEALIEDNKAVQSDMEKAAAAWFDYAMTHVGAEFQRRMRFTTFVFALIIAAILDLKPIPFGGFSTMLDPRAVAPAGTALAKNVPYVIEGLQWLVVALASLMGAEFWYNLLKQFTRSSTPPPQNPRT